jgi:hypothetical protein
MMRFVDRESELAARAAFTKGMSELAKKEGVLLVQGDQLCS